MPVDLAALGVTTFGLAWVLTWLVRRAALAKGLLDHPNARSSHVVATPRGGGIAIVAATLLGLCGLKLIGTLDSKLALTLIVGGLPIACIGFVDDRHTVSAKSRFAVQGAAALLAMYLLGGVPPLPTINGVVDLGYFGYLVGAIAIIWTTNLFNFMDGIDGIAASEAVFIFAAGTLIGGTGLQFEGIQGVGIIFAAASCGFLVWNWPLARIFMGDVGSGYLGFAIACMAVACARNNSVALYVWLILGGVFFVDSTVTLLRRLARGEHAHIAHRSHGYQWLSRRWKSHQKVTLMVLAVNGLWLLPMACLCQRLPQFAVYIVVISLGPLVALALWAGAGRMESVSR